MVKQDLEPEEDSDPLCCCEYKNVHGERAHLCGLLCDCAELDDAFDKAFKGLAIPEQRGGQILEVIEDRLRLPWPRGAIKVPLDKVGPWLLVPLLFKIASQSWLSQVLVHGSVLPLVIFSKYKMCLRGYRPHTKFFASWSLATFFTLFYIYQIHVVGFISLPRTVSFWENLVAMAFLAGATYSVYKARSYSHDSENHHDHAGRFCKICNQHIPAKDHHCIWIDACISHYNMKYFLGFLACILVTLLQAGTIFLTSVCLPIREFGTLGILIPDKWCQRWNTHFEGDLRLTLTAGIHCLLLSIP